MMGDGVVRLRDANLRIRSPPQLAPELERHHARQVRPKRQIHQVEHQVRVVGKQRRNPERFRELLGAGIGMRGRLLHPPLHVPHRVDILVHRLAIAGAERPLQPAERPGHRIENAPIAPQPRQPRRAGRPVAEQPLEHHRRIGFHRQRAIGRDPRERIDIRAAVAPLAAAHREVGFERQFQRAQRRLLAQLVGRILIHRPPGAQIRALRVLDPHPAQITPARARMRPAARIHRIARHVGEPADDGQMLAERRQRPQDGRDLERLARGRRNEIPHDHPVRQVHHPEPLDRCGRRRDRRERRDHRIEPRQRHHSPEPSQNRAAGQRALGHHHHRPPTGRCQPYASFGRERSERCRRPAPIT